MKLDKGFFSENIKTLFYALVIAVVIRSLFIQPFYIPSSSMEPTLLVGDRLFVTKYSYGYSKHSFPFSPPILNKRVFFNSPERGDVIVFKTPADNRTDYIKRLVGLPGDKIQFIDANLYLNNSEILKSKIKNKTEINCGNRIIDVYRFEEKLPNGRRPRSSSPLLVARRILDLTNQIRSMLHLNGRQGPKPVSRMDGGSS